MGGDWKLADEIELDMRRGEAPELSQIVLDLWRRVDELETELAELRRVTRSN
jgi:hypothetical protein